ncbi:conserved hypothetical protein [Neisseria gonorrhoeae]|uniref:Uncharacterized protein n=1 Tax=Neisseria gonorrhoeae TaxID=485 RepID=A0AB74EQI8_NEIGO|nr:conserved hypothetical protein [Neisseria gonorrhoeae]SCW13225.1 conserved hypothetical protein [Neisseria gonorrhoeae]SCW15313.1 conserved hypothetical protein [Neisseria gonorrhoeae]SCW15485.1 conserved hypothetical protein [Neisseria gonorrhoeae]SCW18375.1 conserved hypothetical protein [Neisseria gonorrhoeae]
MPQHEKCRLKPVQTAFLLFTPYRGGNLQPAYITKIVGRFFRLGISFILRQSATVLLTTN